MYADTGDIAGWSGSMVYINKSNVARQLAKLEENGYVESGYPRMTSA